MKNFAFIGTKLVFVFLISTASPYTRKRRLAYPTFSSFSESPRVCESESEMSVPSRQEILGLFRSLLRVARSFPDYNIREYTKRRTIDAFRQNRNLSDPNLISSAYNDGKSQLAVAKRQAVVYSLYTPQLKSVMELQNPK